MSEPDKPELASSVEAVQDAAQDAEFEDSLSPYEEVLSYDIHTRAGASPMGKAAAKALGAMDRAARSFTLYDPGNEAVSHFLEDIESNFAQYFEEYGPMVLEIQPYVLSIEDEVVYEEMDREKSLAFRLFRDGVRRLMLNRDTPWEELLQLLQILSVRFSGVRSNEDDLVTLLWKAGFKHVEVEAVEGFVPEDEEEADGSISDEDLRAAVQAKATPSELAGQLELREPASDSEGSLSDASLGFAMSQVNLDIPEDFDLPIRNFPPAVTPSYVFVEDDEYERLMAEDGAAALPLDCIRLVAALIHSAQSSEQLDPEDFLPLLVEIRDFMLTQGQLENLMLLMELVGDYAGDFESGHAVHQMLASFANANALGRLVRSVPSSSQSPPDEFYELLDSLPGDHLQTLLDILLEDRATHSRRISRQMIERYAHGRVDRIKESLMQAKGAIAADLLRALANVSPADALSATQSMMGRDEIEVLLECMHLLERNPDTLETRTVLFGLIRAKEESIRIRAIGLCGRRRDRRDFPALQRHAVTRTMGMSNAEALEVGRAMALVDPVASMELFEDWLRPKGILKKMRPVQKGQDVTAIGGLECLDFEEADELLKLLAKRAGGEVYEMCMTARSRRRHRLRGEGGS